MSAWPRPPAPHVVRLLAALIFAASGLAAQPGLPFFVRQGTPEGVEPLPIATPYATPIAAPFATPVVGEARRVEIASVGIEAISAETVLVAMAQIVIPPGVAVRDAGTPGPRILVVRSGEVQVLAGASATQRRDGPSFPDPGPATPDPTLAQPAATPILPGTAVHLIRDDTFTQAAGRVLEILNRAAQPAVLLDLSLLPPDRLVGPFTATEGWSLEPLLRAHVALPENALTMSLEEWSLPDGGAVSPPDGAGSLAGRVEGGMLTLQSATGTVFFAEPAALAPGSVGGALEPLPPGEAVRLGAGGLFVADEAAAISLLAETPARLLVVTIR